MHYLKKELFRCKLLFALLLGIIMFEDKTYVNEPVIAEEEMEVSIFEEDRPLVTSAGYNGMGEVPETDAELELETEPKDESESKSVSEDETENEPELETEKLVSEQSNERNYVSEPYIIECTAYEPTGNRCRDETWPVEGETLAGKYEWLGRSCNLYYVSEDGSVGNKIGSYVFHDTGFGHDPDGDGIGSIQTGERIDLYMDSVTRVKEWGVKKVYIEFLD